MIFKITRASIIAMTIATILVTVAVWQLYPGFTKTTNVIQTELTTNQSSKLGFCEKCNKPLRTVHGKFGDFTGCSGYPKCKYIQRKKASFRCPQCAGDIEQRRWSGGILWGCNNYPDCRYAIFSDIEDRPCTKCNKSPYLLKQVDEQAKTLLTCPEQNCKNVLKIA